MTRTVLSAHAVTRRFGKTTALDSLDLSLEEGAFMALLGPAGAGKTTTLRILAGLDTPDEGRIEIDGVDATALEPRDRDVAMIFDSLALYPQKTGFENIANPLRVARVPRAEISRRVAAVAETLQVSNILDRTPRTMSGGEKQRIALGRGLVREPAYFLLDEPLSSLDAKLRVQLRAELRRLQRERNATFLFATPDFTEAMAVADRVAVLIGGRIRQIGAPQKIYDTPVDRDVARFVGAPEINLLAAEYAPADGGTIRVAGLTLPAAAAHASLFNGAATDFEVGLRPERVRLGLSGEGPANARVIDSEPLGLKAAVTVDTGVAQIRATIPEQDALGLVLGTPVSVSFEPEQSLSFDARTGHRLG